MSSKDWLRTLWLVGGLVIGCAPPPTVVGEPPTATSAAVVASAAATASAAAANGPAAPSVTSPATHVATEPPADPLPAGERLPPSVAELDPFGPTDAPPTPLRFAHATSQGVFVHVGRTMELSSDFNYVEQRKPKVVSVLGASPPIDILPSVPVRALAEAEGTWEVFDGASKVCEGKLVGVGRATYLRNLDGNRSMQCQEVGEGLGRPLSRGEIAQHYALLAGFGGEITGRVHGCKPPAQPGFLWARPAGSGSTPQDVRMWATDGTAAGQELLTRTRSSASWQALAQPIRAEYGNVLPGADIPSRTSIDRRTGTPNGLPGWSVWTQLGNTMQWGDKVIPVAETSLWDLYSDPPDSAPALSARVRSTLELRMVASGRLGDGVELVAIARSQCHDIWLMLGRHNGTLAIRRELTVTCWCSD